LWTANRRRTTFELRFDAYAFLESAGLAKREFRRLGFIEYDTTGLAINPSLLTIVVHE